MTAFSARAATYVAKGLGNIGPSRAARPGRARFPLSQVSRRPSVAFRMLASSANSRSLLPFLMSDQ